MKRAEEIYNLTGDDWYLCDYQPMLNEFGEIILQRDEENYQGDSFLIYKDGDRYGYLNFGWGSCSGCDALQACSNIKQVQELMDELYSMIQWFDSIHELKSYFVNKDWSIDYQWGISEFREFVKEVALLREDTPSERRINIAREIMDLEGVLRACDVYDEDYGLFSFNYPMRAVLPKELNKGFIDVIKQRINELQKEFEEL
jgi:hypothetical protein